MDHAYGRWREICPGGLCSEIRITRTNENRGQQENHLENRGGTPEQEALGGQMQLQTKILAP
jgi:hypothetical protein